MSKETRSYDKATELDKYSDVKLFGIFDQTRDAIVSAIELEWKKLKINYPEVKILLLLNMHKRMTVAKIATPTSRRLHSVYSLIGKMEKKGLVERVVDKIDNRVCVQLTPLSLKVLKQVNNNAVNSAFSVLSDREKKQLEACIIKLRTSIYSLLGLDYRPPFLK